MTVPWAVVIGVGNAYRRDDGIGPAVASCVEKLFIPGVFVAVSDGEPAGLLDLWAGADLAVIIDAILCEPATPGRIRRTDLDALGRTTTTTASTHSLGISDALPLGCALGKFPDKLVVLAVEAARLDYGVGLSESVAAAVPRAVEAVLTELERGAEPTTEP
ncbi:hydrogenase maturation protease [Nocardia sp. NPDC051463]|uniref:hydrogenase maturation protease n=1 Tax=Nocardia sp. NPDC051463 TaxID=3154845 RepID=UPI00342243E9